MRQGSELSPILVLAFNLYPEGGKARGDQGSLHIQCKETIFHPQRNRFKKKHDHRFLSMKILFNLILYLS